MKRNFRLTHRKDFLKVRSEGQTQKNQCAVLLYRKNELEKSRVAVVASKKIGNAVQRNRVKRVMRACIDHYRDDLHSGWDLIFYARILGSKVSFEELCGAIEDLLNKANLII
jgi:ribonuclease P protein component